MSTDRIDDIFFQMMSHLRKLFGNGFARSVIDPFKDNDAAVMDNENDDGHDMQDNAKPAFFGYEIVSGPDMKDPVIRMFGNPDDLPRFKESLDAMLSGSGAPELFEKGGSNVSLGLSTSDASGVVEPFTETYSHDGSFIATVDLPGARDADVEVSADGTVLTIESRTEARHYKKEIELGFLPKAEDITHVMNNGLLEVKVQVSK